MLHEGQPREYRFNIINLREMGAHWISDGITKNRIDDVFSRDVYFVIK